MSNTNSFSQPPQPTPTPYMPSQKQNVRLFFIVGIVCAIVSLFVVPEIFGSVAIILGAYTWRMDYSEKRSRGLVLIIFALIAMFAGIYYTSFIGLYQILP